MATTMKDFLKRMGRKFKWFFLVILLPLLSHILERVSDWILGDEFVSHLKKRFDLDNSFVDALHLAYQHWVASTFVLTCAVVCLSAVLSIRKTQEEKTADEKERAVEPSPEFLKAHADLASLTNVTIAERPRGQFEERQKHAPPDIAETAGRAQLLLDDPYIYVRFETGRSNTRIILSNRGKSVAHRVQVQPVVLSVGTATVKKVDFLNPFDRAELQPEVDNRDGDLAKLFDLEANAKHNAEDFTVPMSATYQDVTGGRHFKVTFNVAFFPTKNEINRDLINLGIVADLKPVFEVRDTNFEFVKPD
jgi:hypothetical protein